jgi:hypothetical protein
MPISIKKTLIEKYIVVIFVVMCIMSFASAFSVFFYYKGNSSNSGPFGDTIGGIAGPIINIIAALLVYLSFRKQTEANEIIVNQISTDEQRNIMSELSNDIARTEDYFSEIEFSNLEFKVQARGLNAVKTFLEYYKSDTTDKNVDFTKFNSYLHNNAIGQELLSMLIKCRFIKATIEAMITNENFKRIANKRLTSFYTFKLYPATKEIFDYAADIIFQSKANFDAAIDLTPNTLITKKIWMIYGELHELIEE